MPCTAASQVDRPDYPLQQMTTYELRDYRRSLERAIGSLPPTSAEVDKLRAELDGVKAEQDARPYE
jgi:hypothetical protein